MALPCRSSLPCGLPSARRSRSRRGCRRRSGTGRPARRRNGGTVIVARSSVPSRSSTHAPTRAISRPVFSSCSSRRPPAPSGACRLTSTYWPPTMPLTPVAAASSRGAASTPLGSPRLLAEVAERLGVEPVAGEDRDVLAELHVGGRLAAAQVVVVHRRQVVVDQRVGVDQLDRAASGRTSRRRAERAGGGEREHRADALAAGQQRVAHRLLEPRGARRVREAQRCEVAPRPPRAGPPGSAVGVTSDAPAGASRWRC